MAPAVLASSSPPAGPSDTEQHLSRNGVTIAPGIKAEYKIYQEQAGKPPGERSTLTKLSELKSSVPGSGEDAACAFIVTQKFTDKGERDKTLLKIQSPHLLGVFRDVVGSYPTVPATFNEPFEIESSFHILFHHWTQLHDHEATMTNEKAKRHLHLLFEFMDVELGDDRDKYLSMTADHKITYKTLWQIFQPGALLYKEEKGHPWLLTCVKTAYDKNKCDGDYCEVHCRYTDFDGTHVGLADHVIKIVQKEHFGGDNPAKIVDLSVYPRRFVKEGESLEARLEKRGEKFLQIRDVTVKYYNGLAVWLKEPPLNFFHTMLEKKGGMWLPFTESGRVVLDRKTFREENFLEAVTVQPHEGTPDARLCPPFSYGYSISRKAWCRYFIDAQHDVAWNHNAWDNLLLEEGHKQVLKSLVAYHAFPTTARDPMQLKGKGLVVLLHGMPGSGKTLTAECAAEASGRILIPSTIGELNKDNSTFIFEQRLQKLLEYATTWKAVLLLDEADVFLEARDMSHTSAGGFLASDRNGLVAVFLKQLEFFSGIVFLTTNRIHAFDPAMKSRIHLAIGYSSPESEMRAQLWRAFLRRVPQNEIDLKEDELLPGVVDDKLNGREIAYAVHCARTLARSSNVPLRMEHIAKILEVRREFEKSLVA